MTRRIAAYIVAAFVLGGCIASLQYHAELDDLSVQVEQLRQFNSELIQELEQGE